MIFVADAKTGFIITKKGRKGEYTLSTVKDRGRDDVEDAELNDFAKDYLQGVAGWKPRPFKEA